MLAVYSFTTTDELSNSAALKALDEMQRSSIPLLEIENCSCRNLLNTARQCAMKCLEQFHLQRCYGCISSDVTDLSYLIVHMKI